MTKIHYYMNWLFKDQNGRKGKYVIAEVPNAPLLIFMVTVVLSVIIYPGFWQKLFAGIAYLSVTYWGYHEWRGGRSRFRKLLGILGMVAVVGAIFIMKR